MKKLIFYFFLFIACSPLILFFKVKPNVIKARLIAVPISKLNIENELMYYGDTLVNIEKNLNPYVFIKCNDYVNLLKVRETYYLKIKDNV